MATKNYDFDGVNWVEVKPSLPSLDYVYHNFVETPHIYSPYIPIENDKSRKQIQTYTDPK